ncbi:hypothetical protein FisN_23Hu071 [Fistulifera solaris]|uniref:Peptidyl-prolyl cis-trans isomerase n=1 Tax=Fistulifera solaris TaxID=1519565 RepID=A0A1Z5KMB3_FISSO|nr:hypothetical protein FisN_23Hu071 [Fistulifera solaris]|eukprot:GAX27464.1 hypothetical protein FisN_23Hu071 [Fistulifera solaris]
MRVILLLSLLFSPIHAWSSCSRRQALIGSSAWVLSTASVVSADETITPAVTHTVYMDIQISEKPIQRLEIDLFGKEMPNVVGNFLELCRNNAYAGSSFYRVLSDFSIQGGAIENSPTTTVDNYSIKHTQRGLVSTGLPNSADSRFFVQCTDDAGWADDRYAAFGKVTDATFNVVKEIEKVPVQPPKNAPKSPVRIVASGLVREY